MWLEKKGKRRGRDEGDPRVVKYSLEDPRDGRLWLGLAPGCPS